jgi:beta-lactamase class A
MSSTILGRKMMDFQARAQGKDNFTSCSDLLIIFEHFNNKSGKYGEALRIMKQQQHKELLGALLDSDAFEFAHKTGGLPQTRNDAGIMYLREKIFLAYMCKEAKHEKDAHRLAHEIGLAVYEELKNGE